MTTEATATKALTVEQARVIDAVLYALKEGCFYPVPMPDVHDGHRAWVQWGAMRFLHDAIRQLDLSGQADRAVYQRWHSGGHTAT